MNTSRHCPRCLQSLPADAPDGLCPQCLLRAASGPLPSAAGDGLPGDIVDIGDPAEVAKKLPQFEILEMLGRGGMGVVYRARQLQLDRLVALKILPPVDALSPDFVARFTREARALARLNHPNIVHVHDFGETGGLYYIVMEYVEGANLRQLLETRKLTPAEALAIVPRICDALEYAHEEGLVHRDIKPENLLIDKKGRVKIADFGLAKLLRREPLDMTLTLTGITLGTLRYMAPEQMDKPESVDHRADLYSLGVVIYEMLTGETPVGRFELPSQKAQVDVRFDAIVLHALEREPSRRYQHASEVRVDVENVTGPSKGATSAAPMQQVDSRPPAPSEKIAPVAPPEPADYVNKFLGFLMSPQPGYAKQVGVPMMIFTGVWMLVTVAVMVLVPAENEKTHVLTMSAGVIGIPLGLLILSLRWAVCRGRQPASPAENSPETTRPKGTRHLLSACLVLLCLFAFFFGVSFQVKTGGSTAGITKLVTVGALDPLYTTESGPSGFQTGFNFFSWSFFAVVVAGIAFGALWRIGREDQGKVPRDEAWWRDWWKQVGVWGGLLLVACIVRTVMHPEKVLQPPGERVVSSRFAPKGAEPAKGAESTNELMVPVIGSAPAQDLRFAIQQDRSQLPATAAPGRQDYAFKFSGPADHTLCVWMEVWHEGKMEWVSDFDFEAKPKSGEPLEASLKLTTMDGDVASVESKGKTRFDWTMHCGGSNGTGSTGGAWRANILKPMGAIYSTWGRQPKALNPRPGETVTVLGITGYELSNFRSAMSGHTEADLLKRWPNAAVLIRARFSPARPGQINEGVVVSVNVSDKAGERRTFAQFEISKQLGVDLSDCRTPAEAHAALVAAASTPDGRARVAQMVDEFGSDNISYVDQFRFAAEPMLAMWWKLRKKEPATAEELVGLLENFITAVNGPGSHGVRWNHGEPIIKWAEGPYLNDSFAKKLKLTKLQIDEVNKLFKKYADEANALRRRHTKVTKNEQGHVLINVEPYSEECLELARKMVAELGGIVTQDIVPAVKVGALPTAIFGNAGECRETTVLKKDADGVYVIRIATSDCVTAHGTGAGNSTTGWGSKDIDLAFGSYKMYWTEE